MILNILGSSSKGNCYVLDNGKEALVIECGISFKNVLKAVDFALYRIVGAIVSHEHGDHAKYINQFLDARVPVYMSAGTMLKACSIRQSWPGLHVVAPGKLSKIGNYLILPFRVEHDAAEPMGFVIKHPEMGTTLFATDTYYLQYRFSGLNNILIECNYSIELLEASIRGGNAPLAMRDRTIRSHCSLSTCREILLSNDLSAVNNIVLIHLSDTNSNADEFKRDISEATGKTVHVATKGMSINFNSIPF